MTFYFGFLGHEDMIWKEIFLLDLEAAGGLGGVVSALSHLYLWLVLGVNLPKEWRFGVAGCRGRVESKIDDILARTLLLRGGFQRFEFAAHELKRYLNDK